MNYGAVVDLGNLFGDFKNTSAAIEQFEKAIQLRPEHYLAYYNLGMVYLEGQQRTKAIDFLSKAYKLRPEVSIEKELKRAHLLK